MSKPNQRRVRMQAFKAQISETVLPENARVPIDLDDVGTTVTIKIPVLLEEGDDFLERLQACKSAEEIALLIFDGDPDVSAEVQWTMWREAGYTGTDLMKVFGAERAAAEDRLKAFRYRA